MVLRISYIRRPKCPRSDFRRASQTTNDPVRISAIARAGTVKSLLQAVCTVVWVGGLVSSGIAQSGEICSHRGWRSFQAPKLGVCLLLPPGYEASVKDEHLIVSTNAQLSSQRARPSTPSSAEDRAVKRAFEGRSGVEEDRYFIHMEIGRGDLRDANKKTGMLIRDGRSYIIAIGRFPNPPAKHVRKHGWEGYEDLITCSTMEKSTGFHAAAGQCYGALISDGRRFAWIDSTPLTSRAQEALLARVIDSVRFLPDSKASAPVLHALRPAFVEH